jgi:23S rRNA (uracil1939-C5)-methyltransferase
MKKLRKGDNVELQIESLAFGGLGVAKHDEQVIFVRGAIPGQKVITAITRKKKSYLEGLALETLSESPNFINPECNHFKYCGGCVHQNLTYAEQLKEKQAQVENIFQRMGKYKDLKINPIIGCENIWNYRNKMEFTFSSNIWHENSNSPNMPLALGLHIPKRFDKILDISDCHIQNKECNDILNDAKSMAIELGLTTWDVRKHEGFLRNLVLRKGHHTNEIMVNIVTSEFDEMKVLPIVQNLTGRYPNIKSIVNNVTSRHAGTTQGQSEHLLFGESFIHEKLDNFSFEISANSFFQTNTVQADKLYQLIKNECNLAGDEVVYDLFCGTGSISIFIAENAKHVYGFELVESAVKDAERNTNLNKIKNCSFYSGDLMDIFQTNNELSKLPKPEVMVIDPPRSGMHPKTVQQVLEQSPNRIVYVSCNPSTQVRDIKFFTEDSYKIKNVQPIDMFPHTPHVENIVMLEK